MAPFSSKEMVFKFFTKTEEGVFKCQCGKIRKQTKASGYSNLLSHIHQAHKNYNEIMAQSNNVLGFKVSEKASSIYGWLEWIIMGSHPFSFVENELNNKYSNLPPISKKTFMVYLQKLTTKVESAISEEIPDKFGLIIDGWSDYSTSTHYFAIFSCFAKKDNSQSTVLLAFSPLFDESELNAENHVDFIKSTLQLFGKSCENLQFITGDNASVNNKICKMLGVPLIGCYSHRLNLAVNLFLQESGANPILTKINELMKKMSGLKRSAALRQKTNLRPVIQNDTRWSSIFDMLERYFEIVHFFDKSQDIIEFHLSPSEDFQIKCVFEELKKFESISKALQREKGINLSDARKLFDTLLECHPELNYYLGLGEKSISKCPDFERAVVKAIKRKSLDSDEKQVLSRFAEDKSVQEVEKRNDFAESVLQRENEHFDLAWLPATSNTVERLFSVVRAVFTDYRKKTSPINLEAQIFLQFNKEYWNVKTVADLI